MEERSNSSSHEKDSGKAMPPNKRVACVAVIGANNGPLFIKVYEEIAAVLPRRADEDVSIQMQEVVYNALDVVEERLLSMKAAPSDGFLGCLAVVGPLALYGFVSNTRQKLICAVKTTSANNEGAVKILFRKLHAAVVSALLNPFSNMDEPIRSSAFVAQVDDISRRFL